MNPILKALSTIVLVLLQSQAPTLKELPAVDHPTMVLANEAAVDIATVVGVYPEEKRVRYAKFLYVFGYYEGGWAASPKGYNDGGRACGVMQVHAKLAIGLKVLPPSMTCEALRADRVLGFQAGLLVFIHFETACKGNLRCALNGYASGQVNWGSSFMLPVVKYRCAVGKMDC